jgi:phosphopantothenoylcysteine decarboxylase/phosphopantothenate--cysteine ligase
MSEPTEIANAIEAALDSKANGALAGFKALVTAGPTQEPLDPVRFISNHSSGKQGYAIAHALADAGAETTLVSGPVEIAAPSHIKLLKVTTALEMLNACESSLPVNVAVCAAAVADWRPNALANSKIKKTEDGMAPTVQLTQNPDILATLSHGAKRPTLVIGFAAETENVVAQAQAKRVRKGCDWIVANDVSPGTGIFGGENNRVHLITPHAVEDWPTLDKREVARRLVGRIAETLKGKAA